MTSIHSKLYSNPISQPFPVQPAALPTPLGSPPPSPSFYRGAALSQPNYTTPLLSNFIFRGFFGPCPGGTCSSPTTTTSTTKKTKAANPSDAPPVVEGKTAVERTLKLVEYIDENLQRGIYQATTQIDLDQGLFQCDCSGMVDWILSGSAPQALKETEAVMKKGHGRPVVATYVATLKKIPYDKPSAGWQHVQKIADAKPGDIIAWPTPDWYPSEATGHMGIVVGEPEAVPGGYLIRIADSTSYPHGEDTRREGSGFGYGTILITVDDQTGAGTGQGWTGRHSEATVIRTPIYIGRPLS